MWRSLFNDQYVNNVCSWGGLSLCGDIVWGLGGTGGGEVTMCLIGNV